MWPARPQVIHTRVFAACSAGGNPCPVVLGADDYSSQRMQDVAAQYGLDTAFVFQGGGQSALTLRYFVPERELGVSGHATIAAITVALREGLVSDASLLVDTINGLFPVSWTGDVKSPLVNVGQNAPRFGTPLDCEQVKLVMSALRLSPSEVAPGRPVQAVSVSRAKLLIPVTSVAVLDGIEPDLELLWTLCEMFEVTGFYVFTTQSPRMDADADARQFPYKAGFPEDAATGVAAAALAAYLDRGSRSGAKRRVYQIAQGLRMGSPSLIEASVLGANGSITATAIAGRASIKGKDLLA